MSAKYTPHPTDVSEVVLSPETEELIRTIAFEMHETQAQELFSMGWHFGDVMSIVDHTHPNLIPYDDLTEIQKERYLDISSYVVKVILALGYEIRG